MRGGKMEQFRQDSGDAITEAVAGKRVGRVEFSTVGPSDFLIFHFTDGAQLRLRYDFIYEWELVPREGFDAPKGNP